MQVKEISNPNIRIANAGPGRTKRSLEDREVRTRRDETDRYDRVIQSTINGLANEQMVRQRADTWVRERWQYPSPANARCETETIVGGSVENKNAMRAGSDRDTKPPTETRMPTTTRGGRREQQRFVLESALCAIDTPTAASQCRYDGQYVYGNNKTEICGFDGWTKLYTGENSHTAHKIVFPQEKPGGTEKSQGTICRSLTLLLVSLPGYVRSPRWFDA